MGICRDGWKTLREFCNIYIYESISTKDLDFLSEGTDVSRSIHLYQFYFYKTLIKCASLDKKIFLSATITGI